MKTRLASILAISLIVFGTLCLLLSPSPALADDVIFSNLGPGNSFNTGIAWAIAGPTSVFAPLLGGGSETVGEAFTPSGNFDLSQVLLPLGGSAGTNGVDVFLESTVGGFPGAVLESWSVTGLSTTVAKIEDLSASGVQPLSAGTTYWIVVAPIASDASALWNYNDIGDSSEFAFNNGLGWSPSGALGASPALEVTGTAAVPEPSSLLLLSAGLLGLALLTPRRLNACPCLS